MDETALDFLESLKVPFIKLGSGDSNNLRLIKKAARTGVSSTLPGFSAHTAFRVGMKPYIKFRKIGNGEVKSRLFQIPLVISTGMSDMKTVERIYSAIPHPVGILQCTSAYPTQLSEVNLNVIDTYRRHFPDAVIGW